VACKILAKSSLGHETQIAETETKKFKFSVKTRPRHDVGAPRDSRRWDRDHIPACGLTACTPGSAPGPALSNEHGKPLPFLINKPNCCSNVHKCCSVIHSKHFIVQGKATSLVRWDSCIKSQALLSCSCLPKLTMVHFVRNNVSYKTLLVSFPQTWCTLNASRLTGQSYFLHFYWPAKVDAWTLKWDKICAVYDIIRYFYKVDTFSTCAL